MQDNIFKIWLDSSYLTKNNQTYIDQIYQDFLRDPHSIDRSWHDILHKLCTTTNLINQLSKTKKSNKDPSIHWGQNIEGHESAQQSNINDKDLITISIKVLQLINSFRMYGHQYANIDPLGLHTNKSANNYLQLDYYNFKNQNLSRVFDTTLFGLNKGLMTLQNMHDFFKNTYCGSVGIEYMHILDVDKVAWIQNYFESKITVFKLSYTEQKQCLKEIIAAEGLENYLGTKFPGSKRFSLEGGDVLIPMLKEIIRYSTRCHDIQEIFLGMAHRGRLNVLINVFGKNPKSLFNEFSDTKLMTIGSGDVKYHQGLYSKITVNNRNIHLSLLSNPSHLEIITPIIMGSARSRVDQLVQKSKSTSNSYNVSRKILPIVIHGDAAISGQGIVQESLNMSNTHAYGVGGMIHIIINNQIGFTTSNIYNLRSTPYCTDIAKMIQAPILHVNADDVDAVMFVTRFALTFRHKFNHDIIIDLVCYRRHGHNETDEPSVTQPIMYKNIRNHPKVSKIYSDILTQKDIININEIKNIERVYYESLIKQDCLLEQWKPINIYSKYYLNNCHSYNTNPINLNKIGVSYLQKLALCINTIPAYISMHDRVKKIYHNRIEMALGKRLFDWGGAEILSYATLLDQGYSIRLSGEDVARGTFFHRHAIIHDQVRGTEYIPLMHINKNQGLFFVWDSVLSEESALAFEYGYASVVQKNTLVIWEAQFGDFSNGAQVVIDQFISSGEQKWNRLCGLIMLLPHGYEGQGPEHSSCRIERYLQLCAEHNMQICVPSNPAQIYHIFRQHANQYERKPLIIISPKSLLRHSMVTSSIEDLAYGSFKTIFDESDTNCIPNKIDKVIICTGKIYYDLVIQRNQIKYYNIAIIRIEQLYPFPDIDFQAVLKPYNHVKNFIWCQEEPRNQGAWNYIQQNFSDKFFNIKLNYIGRSDSASPAVGCFSVHQQQQKQIINDALGLNQ